MTNNEIWVNNSIKDVFLRILHSNPDGSIAVTFDFNHFEPNRIHNYQAWYIEQYYTNTGNKHSWSIDPRLQQLVSENA